MVVIREIESQDLKFVFALDFSIMCVNARLSSTRLLKEATHIILSRKKALSLCKKVILSIRHLFRPKNGVSKLFEIFIFSLGAITFSRGLNQKIYLRGSKQDNMIRQSEKF